MLGNRKARLANSCIPGDFVYFPVLEKEVQSPRSFADDPMFQRVMKEALAIQDRFSAEPIYAKTGKGYLKSVGVSEIQKAKEESKKASK